MIRTHPTRLVPALAALLLTPGASIGAQSERESGRETVRRQTTISSGATAMLIDDQLRAEAVRLLQLSDSSLVIVDNEGQRVRISIDGIVALLPARSLPDPSHGVGAVSPDGAARAIPLDELRDRFAAASGGSIETIDGMRFPGDPLPTQGATDEVSWMHPRFGIVSFDLERLASLVKPEAAPLRLILEDDPVEDVLHLANGDRLRGFIISLANPVEIETDAGTIQLPPDRVAAAVFSNPRKHLQGMIVWLDDGTVTGVQHLASDSGRRVRLTLPTGQDAIYEIEHLRAVGFDSGRLVALSDLEPTLQEPIGPRMLAGGIRRVQHPDDLLTGSAATLDAFDIEMPGPMRVRYDLPRGARRFATTASLADESTPWGDCEIVVEIDDEEVFRRRIHRRDPVAPVNVVIEAGRTLTITIDPGRFGPIKDRVILHRPLVLLDQPMD